MAQVELGKLGWRLVLARPVFQSFHFERFVGRRRVAAIILIASSTPRAWAKLRKILKAKKRAA